RVAVLDSAIYGHVWYAFPGAAQVPAKPARLAAVESLLVEVARLPDSLHSVEHRLWPRFLFLRAARLSGDTAVIRRAARYYLEADARLSSADRRHSFYQGAGALFAYLAL